MINRASDYVFYDIPSGTLIDGGILPLRADKSVIRGEDIFFILEALEELFVGPYLSAPPMKKTLPEYKYPRLYAKAITSSIYRYARYIYSKTWTPQNKVDITNQEPYSALGAYEVNGLRNLPSTANPGEMVTSDKLARNFDVIANAAGHIGNVSFTGKFTGKYIFVITSSNGGLSEPTISSQDNTILGGGEFYNEIPPAEDDEGGEMFWSRQTTDIYVESGKLISADFDSTCLDIWGDEIYAYVRVQYSKYIVYDGHRDDDNRTYLIRCRCNRVGNHLEIPHSSVTGACDSLIPSFPVLRSGEYYDWSVKYIGVDMVLTPRGNHTKVPT